MEKVYRILHFPAYLILAMHDDVDDPVPLYTKTNDKTACHLEITKADAVRTGKELGELRVKHRDHYPNIHGSAVMSVDSLEELLKIAHVMSPVPDGYITEFHYNLTTDTTDWIYMDFSKIREMDMYPQ